MAEVDHRDFFISFNSADLAYAEAIDAALRAAGFTTHFHPSDLPAGGKIPAWMDDALMNSNQTLALFSPDYTKPEAKYSRAEREASWWQGPGDDKRKLIPVLLRDTIFTPLIAPLKRIDVRGMTREEAAAHVVTELKTPRETEQRNLWRVGLPLPKIFNAIYRPNPNFTGRFDALDSLQQSLRHGTNAAITAVAGMGGIGKTTLAAEYCHRFGGRYAGVWWVRAEQKSIMLADLQALGQKLGVVSGQNVEVDARACLDHLANVTEPWLLVYDNAPNPDSVRTWLPMGAVRCIITSRYAGFGDIAPVTPLDKWTDEVAKTYLLSRTSRADSAGAVRLARALDGLPLAAEQAATYLSARPGISFDDYAVDIARLIKRPKPKGATGEYRDTVYAAFVKSLETLSKIEGGDIALEILRLCSFLSPDGVDLSLLSAKRGREVLPASLAGALVNKLTQEDALALLTSFSLLKREDDDPIAPDLIFHRLLLEVTRDWMGQQARRIWAAAAVRLVDCAFPFDVPNPSNWGGCARLMPHVIPLEAHAPRSGSSGKALDRLLNQACVYLSTRGDRAGAMALAERSVALSRLRKKKDPLGLATSLDNLGQQNVALGRLDRAEEAFREALEIEEPRLNPNDPDLAVTQSSLALIHHHRKEFDKAEPLLLRAANIMKAAHGENSAEYAGQLSNLGALYGEWADHEGGAERRAQEQAYKTRALAIRLAVRGPRHPETALSYGNVAVMNAIMKHWESAAVDAEMAVAILFSLYLEQHPTTVRRVGELARFWEESHQSDKAARLRRGDISDLLPAISQIESEQRVWVAKDPQNRAFGPPSRLGSS